MHVAGGVGRSGPQGVPADVDPVPREAPVLPLVVASGWFELGGLPVAFSGEADLDASDGPGAGPCLATDGVLVGTEDRARNGVGDAFFGTLAVKGGAQKGVGEGRLAKASRVSSSNSTNRAS